MKVILAIIALVVLAMSGSFLLHYGFEIPGATAIIVAGILFISCLPIIMEI